jgi:hypothetical protein
MLTSLPHNTILRMNMRGRASAALHAGFREISLFCQMYDAAGQIGGIKELIRAIKSLSQKT